MLKGAKDAFFSSRLLAMCNPFFQHSFCDLKHTHQASMAEERSGCPSANSSFSIKLTTPFDCSDVWVVRDPEIMLLFLPKAVLEWHCKLSFWKLSLGSQNMNTIFSSCIKCYGAAHNYKPFISQTHNFLQRLLKEQHFPPTLLLPVRSSTPEFAPLNANNFLYYCNRADLPKINICRDIYGYWCFKRPKGAAQCSEVTPLSKTPWAHVI